MTQPQDGITHAEAMAITLEYAYRGADAAGAECHVNRLEGCALCDAFTYMEQQLDYQWSPIWWTTPWWKFWKRRKGRR